MKATDIIIGIILLALSAFYYLSTKDLPPPSATENIGSAFFPTLLAVGLALLSILLILGNFFPRKISGGKEEKAAVAGGERLEEDSFSVEAISYKFLLGTAGISTLYVILLPIIGYVITTPIFLIAVIMLLGEKAWFRNIVISVSLTAALYLLFATMLGVTLPKGIFFND